jgi:hypothetical protein
MADSLSPELSTSDVDPFALVEQLAEALDGFPVQELLERFVDTSNGDRQLPPTSRLLVDQVLGAWIDTLDHDAKRLPSMAGASAAPEVYRRLIRPRDALMSVRRALLA